MNYYFLTEGDFGVGNREYDRDRCGRFVHTEPSANALFDEIQKGVRPLPSIIVFRGAFGTGKTTAMLHFASVINESNDALTLYVDNGPTLQCLNLVQSQWGNFTEKKNKPLVLIMDEKYKSSLYDIRTYSKFHQIISKRYEGPYVVLLVSGRNVTDIEDDVENVTVVKMCPTSDRYYWKLLVHHLTKLRQENSYTEKGARKVAEKLLEGLKFLPELLSNHGFAVLSVASIQHVFGYDLLSTQMDADWCRVNTPTILSDIAKRYLKVCPIGGQELRDLMMDTLGAVAVQLNCHYSVSDGEGIDLDDFRVPEELIMRMKKAEAVGLVVYREYAYDIECIEASDYKYKCEYRYQMNSAVTWLCAESIYPSIAAVNSPADRFEIIVAIMMAVMRYTQTGKKYTIHHLKQAVPYSGSELHTFHKPNIDLKGRVFINGPQAPSGDLIVDGVTEQSNSDSSSSGKQDVAPTVGPKAQFSGTSHTGPYQSNKSLLKRSRSGEENDDSDPLRPFIAALSSCPGAENFPICRAIVQCKLSEFDIAAMNAADEFAKMGLSPEGVEVKLKDTIPYEVGTRKYKQFVASQWLTNNWVKNNSVCNVCYFFVTNTEFDDQPKLQIKQLSRTEGIRKKIFLIEPLGAVKFAWQALYPMNQIIHTQVKGRVERIKCTVSLELFKAIMNPGKWIHLKMCDATEISGQIVGRDGEIVRRNDHIENLKQGRGIHILNLKDVEIRSGETPNYERKYEDKFSLNAHNVTNVVKISPTKIKIE